MRTVERDGVARPPRALEFLLCEFGKYRKELLMFCVGALGTILALHSERVGYIPAHARKALNHFLKKEGDVVCVDSLYPSIFSIVILILDWNFLR